jgi:hypothetical protein
MLLGECSHIMSLAFIKGFPLLVAEIERHGKDHGGSSAQLIQCLRMHCLQKTELELYQLVACWDTNRRMTANQGLDESKSLVFVSSVQKDVSFHAFQTRQSLLHAFGF